MRKEFTNCLLTGVLMEVNAMIQKRGLLPTLSSKNDYEGGKG